MRDIAFSFDVIKALKFRFIHAHKIAIYGLNSIEKFLRFIPAFILPPDVMAQTAHLIGPGHSPPAVCNQESFGDRII